MKKALCLVCVLSMLIVSMPNVCGAGAFPFEDVQKGSWYYDDVKQTYDNGYMIGTSETAFSPEGGLTRAMFVTILGRIHGASAKESSFSDVKEGSWYAGYVGWAQNYRIVDGYPDSTFRPDALITRQELAVMIYRYMKFAWVSPEKGAGLIFNDREEIASWAEPAVTYLSSCKIFKGNPDFLFRPLSTATRAEAAALLVRLTDIFESVDKTPSIAGEALENYSLYSEIMSDENMGRARDALAEKTGVDIACADSMSDRAIVLSYDETLRMREYHVYEKDKNLFIEVSTPYAAGYFDRIIDDIFGSRRQAAVPSEFDGYGTYIPDSIYSVLETASSFEIVVESDKGAVFYDTNEKITVRATLLADGVLISTPNFVWSCGKEDGKTEGGVVSGLGGQCVFEIGGMSEPGFMRLNIKAANAKGVAIAAAAKKVSFTGGFGVDILNLEVYKEKPADFDEFWDGQIALLDTINPEVIEKKEYSTATHYVHDMKVACVDGAPASFFVTIPKTAEDASLPINVYVDSYGVDPAKPAFYDNAIGLNICPHSMDNVNTDEYFAQKKQELDKFDFIGTENRETYYFKGMLLRDVQAVRYAKTLTEWDGAEINIRGSSMGGYQAIAVAALENSITSVSASVPGRCDMAGMQLSNRMNPGDLPDWCEAVSYYDTAYFAERVTCPVNVTVGLGDVSCPPSGITCMYNALDCEKTVSYLQNTGHSVNKPSNAAVFTVYGDEIADALYHEISDRGIAGPLPKEDDSDRVLTQTEEALKAVAEASHGKVLSKTFGSSSGLTREILSTAVEEYLRDKYGLAAGCTVEFDEDTMYSLKESYSSIGDQDTLMLNIDYTLCAPDGGYYPGKLMLILRKDLSIDG